MKKIKNYAITLSIISLSILQTNSTNACQITGGPLAGYCNSTIEVELDENGEPQSHIVINCEEEQDNSVIRCFIPPQ